MPISRRIHIQAPGDFTFEQGVADIQKALDLPSSFAPEVEAAAALAAQNPRLPDLDRTDIEFVTIDPPESTDLDQAMFLERRQDGYRVYYAIADVAAFVTAGDAIDEEAHRRGETLYGADSRIPLHPSVLSEGAMSLLPGQLRPALLWMIDLDSTGEIEVVDVRRARVRSRAKLNYAGVQQEVDAGTAAPIWGLLREIGELRQQRERARGGVSLALPEQEVHRLDGHWNLSYRVNHPIEDWNAQISLLTGAAAARLMVQAKVGVLRTLPPPDPRAIERLRLTAKALRIAWPTEQAYPDFIRSLDPTQPRHVAMMTSCTTVLRGAGYAAFNGSLPAQSLHSALAMQYAHVTAPLRRLVDRYAGEVCLAHCAGLPVPDWVLAALPELPPTMQRCDQRANKYERAIIDLTETMMMASRVGDTFDGTIVAVNASGGGIVMLRDLAIEARVTSAAPLQLGADVAVTVVEADPALRVLRLEVGA